MARSLNTYLNKNVDNEQYYPATHHNILQTEQQHQQTIQQCNLHKGKQQQQQQHVHFQQQHYQYQHQHQHQHHLQHQHQHQHQQPQMRPDYGAQTPQQTTHNHSQQHQQYQNLSGVWLAPKPTPTMMMPTPITMTTRPTTPIITNKEIIDDFQEQQPQLQTNNHHSYNHQPQQQQQQQQQRIQQQLEQQHHQPSSNYCLKRLDSNAANGGLNNNTRLIEEVHDDMEAGDFVVGKTYITPPDIPSPPPQPLLSDNKRFVSHSGGSGHKTLTNNAAASAATTPGLATAAVSTLTKTRCQCNKNLQSYANHTPLVQHHHTHCHLHHQHQQHQQQPASTLINQNHNHSHSHNHSQNNEESSVILTKSSSALKSQHYQNQQQQQQQTPHHHSQQQQQYHHQYHHRKMDVFAAAGIDDDDNDTSPSIKNLVYSPEKLRRVRIILFGVGGIVLLALLATALYFIISASDSTDNSANANTANVIQLEDILQGKLLAHHFNGSWSSGSNVMYKEDNAIMEYNVVTKQKTRVLLDAQQQYTNYEKSADGNYLLLAKNYKKNFRHSFVADYDIFDYASGQIKPLEIQKQVKSLLLVQWSPVGNGLIINYERNLYYKPTVFADEIALTHDTNPAILNGIPDWVYEEEVFASNSAAWFSPDGKKLAFIRFDDSPTQLMNFPVYGEAGDLRFQYPFNRVVPYPKAGSPNPRVKLFTSDLESAVAGSGDHLTEIPVPSALNTEGDYLITVVGWLNNTNVMSVWMNRIQNSAHIQIFNGLSRQRAYSLESKTGWVDFFAAPFKNRDGTRIALVLPQAQSDGDEYRHLCIISTSSSSNKPEAITRGKYVVTAILHWDTKNDILFYTANSEKNPEQLHVYAIKAATGQTPKCLTCNLHTSNGIEQTYYTGDFNMANQIIITSLGPSIPQTIIYEYTVGQKNDVSLKKLDVWEDNKSLSTKLKNIAMPSVEIHTFNIADGFKAKVLLQLPPNMDRSGKTKYPMLVDVYGGPDSYSVVDRWMLDWGTYLSSNQSVIYAKIDGRGSGLRGEKLLHSVYLKLGTLEIADQIDVTRKLQEQFSFIDANHTGIWGWSYGGYAAAMALANDDKHVFRCAASVAPVTDWTYYDSIYTERYMGLPTINELGYASSRLSTKAEQLRGKKFLLVHGTLDDNVHYQQAMILAKNLERHDILFKQISYPDEDHSLAGVRPHLYHSLDRFFGDCFDQKRMLHNNK